MDLIKDKKNFSISVKFLTTFFLFFGVVSSAALVDDDDYLPNLVIGDFEKVRFNHFLLYSIN